MRKFAVIASAVILLSSSCRKVADPAVAQPALTAEAEHATVEWSTPVAGEVAAVLVNPFELKGFQLTFRTTPGLTLLGARPDSLITDEDPEPIFWHGPNHDGSHTVVIATNPGVCLRGSGRVVLLTFTGTGIVSFSESPPGAVTKSPTLRNCENYDLPVQYGVGSVVIR